MAEGAFYTFWFEKNLQGDIIAVYNESGTKIITYKYDAWGNVTQTVHNSTGTNIHAQKNPFRYRGYYYDTEIALYYLQSRYYNPRWGRFLNADAISYLGAGDELLSFNLFAYCGNNPVMGYDPEGTWNWGKFWDGVVSIGATIAGVVAAAATGVGILKTTGSIVLAASGGMVIGATVTGVVNNTVNTIYYHNSEGISDLEQDPNESSYVTQGYIDRWSRLDYVKSQLGDEYSQNAWRYYSEYSVHMYGWLAIGMVADTRESLTVSEIAEHLRKAEIDKNKWDGRKIVDIPTFIIGCLGI